MILIITLLNVKFDKLFLNEKYTDLVYFEKGVIETDYEKNNLSIEITSKYIFKKDTINANRKLRDDIKIFIVKKNKKNYFVEGYFKNKKTSFKLKNLSSLVNIDKNLLTSKEVILETDNKFNFKIDDKYKIKNLKIRSNLKFDKLILNYKSNRIKNYLEDYKSIVLINFTGV